MPKTGFNLSNREQFVCQWLRFWLPFLPNTPTLLTFYLFADDANIYFSCKNLNDLKLKLNHELKAAAEWMKSSRLALSIKKKKFVLFHSKKLKPPKSLGLIFDSNLTWKNHIDEPLPKIVKTCSCLLKTEVLCQHWYTYYTFLFPNLKNDIIHT